MTTENNSDSSSNFVFFAITGTIFAIIVVGLVLWMQNITTKSTTGGGFSFDSGKRVKFTPAPVVNEGETSAVAAAPADAGAAAAGTSSEVDMDAVIAAVNKGGCIACHTIPDVPGAVGQVGPDLSNIGVNAATRREGYTAEEYIRESLMDPSAFTAPECPTGPCPPGVMPQLMLDQSEFDALINYLVTLGVN